MTVLLQQTNSRLVPVNELVEEPYSTVLGYPKCAKDELERRIVELKSMGVRGIIFEGVTKLGKLDMLGKGCVGIVVKAVIDSRTVALKIRRLDADRESMEREAGLLKIANSVGVGPEFVANSRNFLASDVADGVKIIKWIKQDLDECRVRSIARQILEQCFNLDIAGLDHGELNNLRKHVIVGEEVTIIDFESASTQRRVSNVTSAAQCLFIAGEIAEKFRSILGINSTDEIIGQLKKYKDNASEENFQGSLQVLKL